MTKPDATPQTRILGCASVDQAVAVLDPADLDRLQDALRTRQVEEVHGLDSAPTVTSRPGRPGLR